MCSHTIPVQMLVGEVCDLSASWGALYESLFYEVRLIHLLHSSSIFAKSGSDGGKSHRSAFELVDDGGENLVVDFIKTIFVDIQSFEREPGNLGVDTSIAFHLCEVAHATQQCIRNSRSATAAQGNLQCGRVGDRHTEQTS